MALFRCPNHLISLYLIRTPSPRADWPEKSNTLLSKRATRLPILLLAASHFASNHPDVCWTSSLDEPTSSASSADDRDATSSPTFP